MACPSPVQPGIPTGKGGKGCRVALHSRAERQTGQSVEKSQAIHTAHRRTSLNYHSAAKRFLPDVTVVLNNHVKIGTINTCGHVLVSSFTW